jgi:hypothetical protein
MQTLTKENPVDILIVNMIVLKVEKQIISTDKWPYFEVKKSQIHQECINKENSYVPNNIASNT